MHRSWMNADRRSPEYVEGVEKFIDFAVRNANNYNSLHCPCRLCLNLKFHTPNKIREHLFFHGIDESYITWIWHGEAPSVDGQIEDGDLDDARDTVEMVWDAHDHCASNPEMFKKLLEDAEKPLYIGCTKYTKLSALVKLYNLKARHGVSDKCFSDMLTLVGDMLPDHNELPLSMYEAKKAMTTLGMQYEKIHACPNDCILYRREYKNADTCPTCETSRWKGIKNSSKQSLSVPTKVLWYFPPIPRFRRMFQSLETSKNLTWHADHGENDGKLRHPSDSPSWKLVDHMWPDFSADPRNLRLAISADGINPHRSLSSRYSCWPVLTMIYNLPPWLCMKRKFMMLTLLISGPHQPGNDIDVYLAPLIEDLKTLWEDGIETYDAYRQETFMLKSVLLWTINDFPAYGNLSGCKVKGYFACPICSEGTDSDRLTNCKKNIYAGHRRFLPRYHPYRKQKVPFNGQSDFRSAPKPLNGEEVLRKVEGFDILRGKINGKPRADPVGATCWKKRSIFYDLEYWKHLHVRHCLDVMHIEKNVCESIVGTLLNMPGKTS